MAAGRTSDTGLRRAAPSPEAVDERVGFGAEFRELARQRRFVRDGDEPEAPRGSWRAATPPAPQQQPQPQPQQQVQAPSRPLPTPPTAASRASTRISEDQRAVLLELSKMSNRLVESREQLAHQAARADRAEADLAAANDRLMAARVLVQDAQRATHASAERCAWLEGRCETLQEALDLAVNASVLTRWRWRRQQRAQG
jgi:hypothetical protein